MNLTLIMTKVFLKIFSRDRQAIIFSLIFPLLMMLAFGFFNSGDPEPIVVGIADNANSSLSQDFIDNIDENPLFTVAQGTEQSLRPQVINGNIGFTLVIPEEFRGNPANIDLRVLIDTSETTQMNTVIPLLQQALVDVERDLRNLEPLFDLAIEDVESRTQSYLDFLVPGLLAMALMQIAMGGSGFNLVEFRRKGILKRLFVTPVQPKNFITGLVLSRLVIVIIQLSILLGIAILLLDITFIGNLFNLYVFIILGTTIFLSLGFCMGSLAKTQQAIMAMNMLMTWPQMLLSGIFYPIDAMPSLVQPMANLLPLSFVVNGLRGVAIEGANVITLMPNVIGILIWVTIALGFAIKLFNWKEVAT
ncbi:MAG: ABC transporter permease [Gammaproteobacteria bacterium]|nr:ABC transporter permease [Gammaproteobacteria bacterium]